MAQPARAGNVYRIDLRDGRPAHYWIVLTDPQVMDHRFLAVSLTDRHNFPKILDVWPTSYIVCPSFTVAKPSVMALKYTVLKSQRWLDEYEAVLVGLCTAQALQRARCNLVWYPQYLTPDVRKHAEPYLLEWSRDCRPQPAKPQ